MYETEPIEVNVIDRQGNQFLIEQRVNVDDLIEFDGIVYQVIEVTGQWVRIKDVSYDQVNGLDLQGSVSLDLSKATTIVQNEILQINERTGAGLSAPALSQSFEVKGFQVKNFRGTDSYMYLESIIISPENPLEVVSIVERDSAGYVERNQY